MDPHTGRLPSSLWLGEQEIPKMAALQPFVELWIGNVDEGALEAQLAAVVERDNRAEKAAYFRVVQRTDRLNGTSAQWLARLATSQNG